MILPLRSVVNSPSRSTVRFCRRLRGKSSSKFMTRRNCRKRSSARSKSSISFPMLHGKGKLTLESTTAGDRTFYSIKSATRTRSALHIRERLSRRRAEPCASRTVDCQSRRGQHARSFVEIYERAAAGRQHEFLRHSLSRSRAADGPLAEKMKKVGGAELTEEQRQMPRLDRRECAADARLCLRAG